MKNKNGSAISRPLGLFVIVMIGIALTVYIVIGIVSVEMKGRRIVQNNHKAVKGINEGNKVELPMSDSDQRIVGVVTGKVISFENGIVVVETDFGDSEITEAQLLINEEDHELIEIDVMISANLSDKVMVSDIEDGALGVDDFIILEEVSQ